MNAPARFSAPAAALVRGVPASYVECLRAEPVPVDPARAAAQAEEYARVLERAGVRLVRLPADEASPDCCFVEDTAVVLSTELAMVTRPGAPSRRGEVRPVAAALRPMVIERVERVAATIDGGDVLRDGETLWVGLSERTNRDGAAALAQVAARLGLRVVEVPVGAGLHLKSAVTLLGPGRLVMLQGALDPAPFRAAGAEVIEVDEPAGGNVLALGGAVLVSSAAPATAERLRREPGVEVVTVDVSELHKGDGALTCLSVRIPPPGAWCA